jgi:signal transduction histidine kinase
MAKRPYRYETEVHLGLLMIVCVLLTLNVVSNFAIYRIRNWLGESTTSDLQRASLAITRIIEDNGLDRLSPQQKEQFRSEYGLSSVTLVPSAPPDNSPEARRLWFMSLAPELPLDSLPRLAERLLGTEYRKLSRSEGAEYVYISPVPGGHGQNLLILSARLPQLALLDNASRLILIVSIGALVVVVVVYLVLSRLIFAPIRKMRREARLAGRPAAEAASGDELVAEYRQIIAELRDKEDQLLRLNRELRTRAESLEQFNQYLLASVDTGILTFDPNGTVLAVNDAAERILPNLPVLKKGLAYTAVLAAYPPICEELTSLIADRVVSYREYQLGQPDGRVLTLGITTSLVRDASGDLVGLSLLISDLSEVSRLRIELEQRSRLVALGEMAGGLAHQLRNSLGAIGGFTTLARRKSGRDESIADTLTALHDEAREAERLIERFLSFARPIQPSFEPVNLPDFLGEVVAGFKARDEYQNIEFNLESVPAITIPVDPLLIKQALGNLIDNGARAYDGRSGELAVHCSLEGNNLLIEITDHAAGIPAEKLETIFTPFYSSRPSGTGLGLPLASRMVGLHGGRISVRSVEGRGSTFTIHLPRERSAEVSSPLASR